MAFLIVLLLLVAAVSLAPWFGEDSRDLDPNHFESVHPLSADRGYNHG